MRGIYILPNMFTAANLACGFFAILKATGSEPNGLRQAAWLILIANIFDILDGRVARWTKATSKFGVEFDSLADLVAFGVAPGVLLYQYTLHSHQTFGAAIGFSYLLCGAARLARFNVQAASETGGPCYFFVGCPIPAASSLLAASVLFDLNLGMQGGPYFFLVLTVVAALMMVSSVPYPSFKKPRKQGRKSRVPIWVLFFFIFISALVKYRESIIFFLIFAYFASGPVWKFSRFMVKLSGRVPAPLVSGEISDVKMKEN